jgi:hypothetical protein
MGLGDQLIRTPKKKGKDNSINNIFNTITVFLFIATFFVYGSFLLYAVLNDYAFYELDQASILLNSTGIIHNQTYF